MVELAADEQRTQATVTAAAEELGICRSQGYELLPRLRLSNTAICIRPTPVRPFARPS